MTEYDGESGYNGFMRGCEHKDAVRLGDQDNALYKHCVLEHGGAKGRVLNEGAGKLPKLPGEAGQ